MLVVGRRPVEINTFGGHGSKKKLRTSMCYYIPVVCQYNQCIYNI